MIDGMKSRLRVFGVNPLHSMYFACNVGNTQQSLCSMMICVLQYDPYFAYSFVIMILCLIYYTLCVPVRGVFSSMNVPLESVRMLLLEVGIPLHSDSSNLYF